MQQLATLKRLKNVYVVDPEDGTLFSAAAVQNLENSIPGVKIKVMTAADFRPSPPAEFLEHVKRTSDQLREKMSEN